MKKILISGPESCGKSTLAYHLSLNFSAPIVKEYAREYLSSKSEYTYDDLLEIAVMQQKMEVEVEKESSEIVFCDTGLDGIKIWSQIKYNMVHPNVEKLWQESNYDLVLLCKPNIPWVYDPLRENPDNRDEIFESFVRLFITSKIPFYIVDERLSLRFEQATHFIKEHFSF